MVSLDGRTELLLVVADVIVVGPDELVNDAAVDTDAVVFVVVVEEELFTDSLLLLVETLLESMRRMLPLTNVVPSPYKCPQYLLSSMVSSKKTSRILKNAAPVNKESDPA